MSEIISHNGNINGNIILNDSGSSNAITLATPSLADDYTLTLPVNDGTTGQVLSTNGSGVTSWIAAAGGTSVGEVTQSPQSYSPVTLNTMAGIIHMASKTTLAAHTGTWFTFNNTNLLTTSIILLSVDNKGYQYTPATVQYFDRNAGDITIMCVNSTAATVSDFALSISFLIINP